MRITKINYKKSMKKLMMMAAFMVVTLTANAQFTPGTWSVQPKGGLGLSTLTDFSDSKITLAGMIGGEMEYQVANQFSVAGGLNFSLQGCDYKDYDGRSDSRIDLGYINIPIVANFYVWKGLAIKAGIQPGFMVYANEYYKKGNVKTDIDVKDNFETFDLSIPIGVSYEFSRVVIDARYFLGVTKVNKGSVYSNVKSHNSVFMITGGYKFRL